MADREIFLLAYEHKAKGRHLVPNGISLMTEYDICIALSDHPDCLMSTKKIEPGALYIDIYTADLQNDEIEKGVGPAREDEVPWRIYLGAEWKGHKYEKLVILTPEIVAIGGREPNDAERKAQEEAAAVAAMEKELEEKAAKKNKTTKKTKTPKKTSK